MIFNATPMGLIIVYQEPYDLLILELSLKNNNRRILTRLPDSIVSMEFVHIILVLHFPLLCKTRYNECINMALIKGVHVVMLYTETLKY